MKLRKRTNCSTSSVGKKAPAKRRYPVQEPLNLKTELLTIKTELVVFEATSENEQISCFYPAINQQPASWTDVVEVGKNSSNGEDLLISPNDPDWNVITCFCNQPFHGRPMIECDMCGVWIHMKCDNIQKSKVPDKYNCMLCRRDAKRLIIAPGS